MIQSRRAITLASNEFEGTCQSKEHMSASVEHNPNSGGGSTVHVYELRVKY